jgi:hypothetical protein
VKVMLRSEGVHLLIAYRRRTKRCVDDLRSLDLIEAPADSKGV